jgi:hydrogenase maturation GTPase HydF
MSLNTTPTANRTHISFFGNRNAGKSSVVNAVTNQPISIVSDVKGTTTDPVYKSMELLPIGPVMIIDTPGLDDEGELGEMRVKRAKSVLNKTDIAVLVIDATVGKSTQDDELITLFTEKNINYIIAYNKCDIAAPSFTPSSNEIFISAKTGMNIAELKEKIAALPVFDDTQNNRIIGDLLNRGDFVILVTPIDESAPKGRLILPQQQTIRDILDAGAAAIVTKETEYAQTLASICAAKAPAFVITDSQAFAQIAAETPDEIALTSFSILMARYKGFLKTAVEGANALSNIEDGDTVLISEACTHHRQCNDIGTVKLPNMIKAYTKKEINFAFTSGTDFPSDLSPYKIVIHCGACMLTEKETKFRMKCAVDQNVPFTNYGTTIAKITGILEKSANGVL